MRVAFIIQRYGKEVLGGSESLCRAVAENLYRRGVDIEVFTTTAKDYISWKRFYKEGESVLNGVLIKRFNPERERKIGEFNRFSDWIFSNPHSVEDEIRWLEEQGPVVPELIKNLKDEESNFDLIVFFTYLYYPTYWGLKNIGRKKALVSTAHDEPPLYLEIMKDVFKIPDGFIFLTEAEKNLVNEKFILSNKLNDVIGMGISVSKNINHLHFRKKYFIFSPFILYSGRIDKGKGLGELFDYFIKFKKKYYPITLALIGNLSMKLPNDPDIRYLGFLSEEDKLNAIASSVLTIHPSHLESFSISALESLSLGIPIVVQERTKPLVEHCKKSNGGLWYSDYEDFEEVLNLLLKEHKLRNTLGENGKKYITENFSWEKVCSKWKEIFRKI
ncbi:MAG: glycosyltransferase family 4 protein [Acidobacteriota bacterium]